MKNSYDPIASFYDPLFFALGKDYRGEAQEIKGLIGHHKKSNGNQLLDLGCGTGEHIRFLKDDYKILGFDNSREMIMLAKKKNPDVAFLQMDMQHFRLHHEFDAAICLFSAISYVITKTNLDKVIRNVSHHLKAGGIFIVESWFSPDEILKKLELVEFGEKDGIKACRMRETKVKGDIAFCTIHILLSNDGHVTHNVSHHKFGLFSKNDFLNSFTKNDFNVLAAKNQLWGRNIVVGIKN